VIELDKELYGPDNHLVEVRQLPYGSTYKVASPYSYLLFGSFFSKNKPIWLKL